VNWYHTLCDSIDVEPVEFRTSIVNFGNINQLANASVSDRLANALAVFLDLITEEDEPDLNKVDRWLIDSMISRLDTLLGNQLDAILHHEDFKKIESVWLSLYNLLGKIDFKANTFLYLLNIDKEMLREDFEDSLDITESGLYKQVYDQAYDMPGGKPISAMISGFTFSQHLTDVQLLTEISKVSASAHCPYIANIDPIFFGKKSIDELNSISNLPEYLERPEYLHWNSFRETEQARYIGLTLPKFLLRLPYGDQNPVRGFLYQEDASGPDPYKYTWGAASFAFAGNLATAFKKHGWTVNIRGPESGGRVDDLALHQYDIGRGVEFKIPTEVLISETKELELSNLGLIPLSYYKDSKHACFFSANSLGKPVIYDDKASTANSRVNSRLPYVFLASRLGHYLKVIQRENIGGTKDRSVLEQELNRWLGSLVTKMSNPSADLVAARPLKEGQVVVSEIPENPGFFKVSLHVMPHFQVEGIDVKLSLVSQIPTQQAS
jgi:type VI secretion system protein ImpC